MRKSTGYRETKGELSDRPQMACSFRLSASCSDTLTDRDHHVELGALYTRKMDTERKGARSAEQKTKHVHRIDCLQ